MKIAILLLLGLASLVASAPQSRFGTSRYQPVGVDYTDDTTESSEVAEVVEEDPVEGETDDADLDAVGSDAGIDEDDTEDTTATSYVDRGEKRPAYGLDAAKERRRLANLRKRFRPGHLADDDTSVTDSPDEAGEDSPASGGQGSDADSDYEESAPAGDDETQSAPVSNFRSRFSSQASSSSVSGDATEDDNEEVASDSADEPANERRTPSLRRRQQSASASTGDQVEDEPTDVSEGTDSEGTVEDAGSTAGTRTRGSLKDRLERYRQRQAERLGTATQTDTVDDSADAPASEADVDETVVSPDSDGDFTNSGEARPASRFRAVNRRETLGDDFTSDGNSY